MYRSHTRFLHLAGRRRHSVPYLALVLGVVLGAAWYLLARRRRGPGSGHDWITQADANADQRLDEAVEQTFPASDPIAVHIE